MKVFSIILSSGTGSRFISQNPYPKQFERIEGEYILLRTLKQFVYFNQNNKINTEKEGLENNNNPKIEGHIVVTNPEYLDLTKKILKKIMKEHQNIFITTGDSDRQGSLLKGLEFLQQKYSISENDIVLTHDSVRPLVFQEVIQKNITMLQKNEDLKGVDTVIPCVDTMIYTDKDSIVESIPSRERLYRGQTPQTFRLTVLYSLLKEMGIEERLTLTDAVKVLILKKKRVGIVEGHLMNMKITKYEDLLIVQEYLKMIENQKEREEGKYGTYCL